MAADVILREDADHYDAMNKIVELYITGNKNPTAIAKLLDIPRKDVLLYIEEWQGLAQNSKYAKERAEEALTSLDKHYDLIIKEMWTIVNDGTTDSRTKNAVLKNIADIEEKRQSALQKAGLYDDAGLTDELVYAQDRADKMKQALVTVGRENPTLKRRILELLNAIEEETVTINDDGEALEGKIV